MNENLLVGLLGYQDAGKSTVWYTLFGGLVHSNRRGHTRRLMLSECEYVDVFLINSSSEERKDEVKKRISGSPHIVLCSLQYAEAVRTTLNYFANHDYLLYVQWLNPGYHQARIHDYLGLVPFIHEHMSLVGRRDANEPPRILVQEMREFIRGWAEPRGLLHRLP